MKNKALFIIGTLLLFSCSTDQDEGALDDLPVADVFVGEVEWIRNYGGSGNDTAQSIIATQDGGYAVMGYTNSTAGDVTDKDLAVNDYWLLKLDAQGEIQWTKTYGGSKDDRGQSVIQTTDGGYAIVGYAMSSDGDGSKNEGFHDNWILRLDAAGEILWERSFGFSGHDHSYDVLQTADGGFFFAGFLDVQSSQGLGDTGKGDLLTRHGVGEYWGTKLDADGNLQWQHYFGGSNNDRAYSSALTSSGDILMTGFSESTDSDISLTKGSYDFWVVKLDALGNFIWERSFGGTGIDVSYDIERTLDDQFVIAGHTFSVDTDISGNHGNSDFWLIKINADGQLTWEKTLGGSEFDAARAVKPCAEGGYMICGNSRSNDMDLQQNAGENDIWVAKTDAEGTLLWQQSFGGSGLDFAFDLVQHSDGSFLVAGQSNSADFQGVTNKGGADLVLIKIK